MSLQQKDQLISLGWICSSCGHRWSSILSQLRCRAAFWNFRRSYQNQVLSTDKSAGARIWTEPVSQIRRWRPCDMLNRWQPSAPTNTKDKSNLQDKLDARQSFWYLTFFNILQHSSAIFQYFQSFCFQFSSLKKHSLDSLWFFKIINYYQSFNIIKT